MTDDRPTWNLWCDHTRVGTTTEQDAADRWVAADPGHHTARPTDLTRQAVLDDILVRNRELFELMGRGGWTGRTGLETD